MKSTLGTRSFKRPIPWIFSTKKGVKNNDIVPQYYVENDHEAIIPREIFMQVQEELVRRRLVHKSPNGKNQVFSSSYCLANIVYCGTCGEFYRRIHWYNRGKKSIVWRCISRLENTGLFCDARTVLEGQIEQVLVDAINRTLCKKNDFLAVLRRNIEDVLREEKQKLQLESAGRDELKKRIADMGAFLREQPAEIAAYDEAFVRRLIEKVTVYEDKFTVKFKSGVTVDVNE